MAYAVYHILGKTAQLECPWSPGSDAMTAPGSGTMRLTILTMTGDIVYGPDTGVFYDALNMRMRRAVDIDPDIFEAGQEYQLQWEWIDQGTYTPVGDLSPGQSTDGRGYTSLRTLMTVTLDYALFNPLSPVDLRRAMPGSWDYRHTATDEQLLAALREAWITTVEKVKGWYDVHPAARPVTSMALRESVKYMATSNLYQMIGDHVLSDGTANRAISELERALQLTAVGNTATGEAKNPGGVIGGSRAVM